jgi:hypothetical protein
MRRYRERKFGNKPPRRAEADLEIAQLKARIAELEREGAQLRPNFNSFSVSSAASAMQVFDLA